MALGLAPAIGLGVAGALGSLFGGRKEPSPEELERLYGPAALAQRQQVLLSLLANSPSFRMALGNTNLAGQNLGQNINANLARSGLLNSGIGAIGSAIGQSAGGFGVQNLVGGLYDQSLSQAGDLNKLLAQLYLGTRGSGPSPLQSLGGGVLGALAPYFSNRFLGGGAGAGGGGN